MVRVLAAIQGWLGWCPNVQPRICNGVIRPDDNTVVPAAGGSFKDRAVHWFGLFRNQILLSSLAMSLTGFWMFAGLGSGSSPGFFILGILAGLPLSAITGIWYWRIFNEVLREGEVVLWNRYDRRSGIITALSMAFAFIPVLVLFGVIPGVTMKMMIAFMGGLVVVPFWGMLISILRWESGTHHWLHYDGMILKLKKEDIYAVY
ncbi:MAG: DUF1673 domain-containing protein [Methanospirillum sp.]|nr:DUF1673 domain-containing protein [Methanospirillum sp.]